MNVFGFDFGGFILGTVILSLVLPLVITGVVIGVIVWTIRRTFRRAATLRSPSCGIGWRAVRSTPASSRRASTR